MPPTREKLFGTNGVRFIPGVTHDLDFAIELGEAIGTYFAEGEILVGRDGRLSGRALSDATIAGLLSSGRRVVEAGLVPTPALQYGVKSMKFRGGVMITASHNPPKYNGVKVAGPDGVEIPRLDEQKVEKIFYDRSQTKADWKGIGTARDDQSIVRRYIDGVLSKVDVKSIAERKFTIVIDAGNGAQALAAPYIAEELGCKVITLNAVIDGTFPGRGPEPTPSTVGDLSLAVRAAGADLGVAYDGDGDRSLFCDEQGRVMWGDETGCFLADYILEKSGGGTIVTPVNSTQAVETVAARRGGRVIRTKVGSVDVSRTIIERGAAFGFEENGGTIYPPHITVRDGGMTTALVLQRLAAKGMSFSKAVSSIVPRYYQAKAKVEVPPGKVERVLRAVESQAKGKAEHVDGVKIWIDDVSWVLVRPSGTEPIVRVFIESGSQEKADLLAKKFSRTVKASAA
jgi:phosphomannomutase / phosphoglucomutase